MLLRLGDQMIIADRMPGGAPGPAYGVPGWGMPNWASMRGLGGVARPKPVGARYFCGDDYPQSEAQTEPCATGNIYTSTKKQYQEAVTEHYTEEHADLHYPVDQFELDMVDRHDAQKAKEKALLEAAKTNKLLQELVNQGKLPVEGGGMDHGGMVLPVTRPRELPDFTEFDFPDANLADAATEEIELDQLISIAARQGRRFLGLNLQNLTAELQQEMLTVGLADLEMTYRIELNTRTGGHNLDDPESLWRREYSNIAAVITTVGEVVQDFMDKNDPPPGGRVYVAPRLFWRFVNNLDRQVDVGDLFVRIATVSQQLSTFLLFELLEEFSGLFGLT